MNQFWQEFSKRSPSKLAWSGFFLFVSLGTTIAVAFSCISAPTSIMYMVIVDPDQVLQNLNYRPSGIKGISLVGLPDRYLFGISGACREWISYDNNNNTRQCERGFPQQLNLLNLVQADIHDQNSSQYKKWTQLLSAEKILSDQETWKSYTQAAAALLILSIFWAVATIALMFTFKSLYPWKIAILDLLDAILVLAAAGLWTAAAVGAGKDYGRANLGPGIWLLWTICIAKICVIPAIALVVFIIIPSLCLIAWCMNCEDPDNRPGEEWCCDAIFCLCCDE